MAQLPQIKRGYIRGVRGAVVTRINADGTPDGSAVPYGIKTTQKIAVETEVVAGEAAPLRGGDKLLAWLKDPDTVVGMNLTLNDARFDAHAIEVLAGGTLIEVPEDTDTRVVGWEAPTIEAQQGPPHFKLEIYAASHNSRGGGEGYVKYTCHYCRATFGGETLEDRQWMVPEIKVTCFQNPSTSAGLYKKEFVDSLPAELQ